MDPMFVIAYVHVAVFIVLALLSLMYTKIKRVNPGIGSYKRSGHRVVRSDLMRRRMRRRRMRLLLPFMGAAVLMALSFTFCLLRMPLPWVMTVPFAVAGFAGCVALVAHAAILSRGVSIHKFEMKTNF